MEKRTVRNSFLLFVTAAIWGLAFVSQSKGMDYMHPLTFNGMRALIGAVTLLFYMLIMRKKAGTTAAPVNWRMTIRAGIWCGLALTAATTLQQYGIKYTTVGKAGFITTLYIIFVPIAGIFFRKRVAPMVWLAAVMAAAGMYLLCMTGGFSVGMGDILVFLCALVFSAHILIIDYFSPKTDGVIVSCIQFAVCGVLCMAGAFVWGAPNLGQIRDGLGSLLYAGVLSCGVAYTLQIVGQKGLNPTVAALILSLESVIATVSGWAAFRLGFLSTDQSMTGRQVAGCVIVFAAVVLAQLPEKLFSGKIPRDQLENELV